MGRGRWVFRRSWAWDRVLVLGGRGGAGKESRTPSVKSRIVGTKQQFPKSKGLFYSIYIYFTRFLYFLSLFRLSSLFSLSLLFFILSFFYTNLFLFKSSFFFYQRYRPYTSSPDISTALPSSSRELQKPRGGLIYVPAGKH